MSHETKAGALSVEVGVIQVKGCQQGCPFYKGEVPPEWSGKCLIEGGPDIRGQKHNGPPPEGCPLRKQPIVVQLTP